MFFRCIIRKIIQIEHQINKYSTSLKPSYTTVIIFLSLESTHYIFPYFSSKIKRAFWFLVLQSAPPRVTIPKAALAFKNQTYQSTDDEDSDSSHVCGRPRSSSDTGLSVDSRRETRLSRSESHKVYSHQKEQLNKPLIALKRNQKLVSA